MVNRAFAFRAGARDFRFKRFDALVQLGDGQGIQILPGKQQQGIVGTPG